MALTLKDDEALSGLSLLSLSAAAAEPVAILPSGKNGDSATHHSHSAAKHHRRLSSSGKSRRRLSDARDAAIRLAVAPSAIHSHASAVAVPIKSQDFLNQPTVSPPTRASSARIAMSRSVPLDSNIYAAVPGTRETQVSSEHSGHGSKGGRKKSTVFTCESCSKVYRHPSCLIKHRWEHSPQWREASKFVLSKHQQVQLLEAAAILSHMDPCSESGTSLPEDRAEWPAFLSGGTLLPPHAAHAGPVSSSVPAYGTFAGPRLHDYSIPTGSVTQLRPGLLGVSASTATPVPVPRRPRGISGSITNAPSSYSYRSPPAATGPKSSKHARSISNDSRWSQPPSSLRSMSRSTPSDDEEELETDFIDDHANLRVTEGPLGPIDPRGREPTIVQYADAREQDDQSVGSHDAMDLVPVKAEQGEWDGMEMEMEMD